MLRANEYQFEEAGDYLAQAIEIGLRGRDNGVEAAVRAGLCLTERALGNLAQAFEQGRLALGLARADRLLVIECEALDALGETHVVARDLRSAEVTFRHAAELSRERHLRSYEARAHEGFAHIALYLGDVSEAVRRFQQALSIYPPDVAETNNSRRHLADGASLDTRCLRCMSGAAQPPTRIQ